jgi:hypothetical protein
MRPVGVDVQQLSSVLLVDFAQMMNVIDSLLDLCFQGFGQHLAVVAFFHIQYS